jgi:hypothetical protein
MIRRSVFLGLTLVLVVALVSLIVRGRRLEKQQAGKPAELVQKSKSSPIRVFRPRDLEIVQSKSQLEAKAGAKGRSLAALHKIEVRNNGSVPYGEIQFRLVYLDRSGRELAIRTHPVTQGILPGTILKVTDIMVGDLPAAATESRISIDYADFGRAPPQGK